MFVLTAKISFPLSRGRKEIIIRQPSHVHIESSWKRLTDIAVITLPRNVSYFDKNNIKDVFRSNDPVKIELGYDGNNIKEFEGYVTRASADMPVKIYCEDAMYKVKQLPAHISLKESTLQNLLFTLVPDFDVDALEVDLGGVRYANSTVAQVLEDLKRKYNLYSYFQNGTLIVGKIYADQSNDDLVALDLEKNVASNNLQYRNADDIKIKVKAVSTQPDGTKISIEVGDDGGEVRQLTYYNIKIKEALTKIAEEDLRKYKVDGFSGQVTTFGQPIIQHGGKVALTSELYQDRSGTYYADSVVIDWGDNAKYRRKVALGEKVTTS